MKEYLTYIVAACAVSCATTPPTKENSPIKPAENSQVKPIVMKSTRDCKNLPPQELIDCITEEESNTTTYVPIPTPPTTSTPYTVTPKAVKVDRDCSNLSGPELFKCINEAEIIDEN